MEMMQYVEKQKNYRFNKKLEGTALVTVGVKIWR